MDNDNQDAEQLRLLSIFHYIVAGMLALFSLFPVIHLAIAACVALAGRKLTQRRGHLFCLVVAGVECCFFPFGTVLGVLTILVLTRPSVKHAFGVSGPSF